MVSLLALTSFIGCADKNVNPYSKNESNTFSILESAPQAFPGQFGIIDSGYYCGDKIYYNRINNRNVFQGDIILADSVISKTPTLSKQTGAIRNSHLWPNNVVYYTINSNLNDQGRVTDAINHWRLNTNLVFIERTTETHYIRFQQDANNGCWSSSIGMAGGEQIISLADWGTTGSVIHEIGHAVNLFHEQTRPDGDNTNVIIKWENINHGITNDWWPQFYPYTRDNNDGANNGNYDFNSIMHYPCYSASVVNGGCAINPNLPVITRVDGTTWNANTTVLSAGDIAASKTLYPLRDADGNVYNTIKIGSQIWTVENLKTTKYNDGTSIPYVADDNAWGALSSPGYCWYSNNSAYKSTYGALYNWYVVDPANPKKIAPEGWRVPTAADWTTLINYLGSTSAGGKMKEAGLTHWASPNTGATNESGFTGLPGGARGTDRGVSFGQINYWGHHWSSTSANTMYAYNCFLDWNRSTAGLSASKFKTWGISVRLIKN
jgi:uncharacterized protein (TIGR02145 family)